MECIKNTHTYALELETAFRLGEESAAITADEFEIDFALAVENAVDRLWGIGVFSDDIKKALLDYTELGKRLDDILSTQSGKQQISCLIDRVKKEKIQYVETVD